MENCEQSNSHAIEHPNEGEMEMFFSSSMCWNLEQNFDGFIVTTPTLTLMIPNFALISLFLTVTTKIVTYFGDLLLHSHLSVTVTGIRAFVAIDVIKTRVFEEDFS